jgi:hypothetical protein
MSKATLHGSGELKLGCGQTATPSLSGSKKERFWEVPAAWFNDLIRHMLDQFSGVYVIQPFREQRSVHPSAGMRQVMSANALAWVPTTAKASMAIG